MMKNNSLISKGRFCTFIAATLVTFSGIAGNLYYLQVHKSQHYKDIIEKSRNISETIEAKRGNIYDATGNLLATNTPYIELAVDPTCVSEKDRAKAPALAEILGMTTPEILKTFELETILRKDGTPVQRQWRKICDIDMQSFEAIKELEFDSLISSVKYRRIYPSGALTSHVIGYVNKAFTPVSGVEKMMDYYLRGQDGWREMVLNGKRREIVQFRQREQVSVDGMDVISSIDIVMQEAANQELSKIVETHNPKNASIIISDTSGFILAMANYPNFDPNLPITDTEALRNVAISTKIEPGSTFKIVPISAALNEQYVTPNDTFECKNSTVTYKGRILKLPKDTHLYDSLSVKEIVKKSSNRGSAHIGILLGEQKLYSYAKDFGFGEKTNIGLSEEQTGTLHEVKNWDGLTITRLPMGHAVNATPLQVHCAMSVIASGGVYMKPQLIKKISSSNGDYSMEFKPKPLRRVISANTAATMSEMLSHVTENGGTAKRAAVDGYKVAGKTGTSQKLIKNSAGKMEYSNKHHVASFSGFFPAERPQLIITVIIDDPDSQVLSAGYGGVSAAPAFSSLAKMAANYYGIQRDDNKDNSLVWISSK